MIRIIPLGRGGLVPARLVSKYLGIDKVDDMIGIVDGRINSLPNQIFLHNAIIVDDIYDTGSTIGNIRAIIGDVDSQTCLYAFLYTKVRNLDDRSIYGYELHKIRNKWIVFPWENGIEKRVIGVGVS